jgi:hypothetical protein
LNIREKTISIFSKLFTPSIPAKSENTSIGREKDLCGNCGYDCTDIPGEEDHSYLRRYCKICDGYHESFDYWEVRRCPECGVENVRH